VLPDHARGGHRIDAVANKWLKPRGDAAPGMVVPERLPAPRCDVCDEEIRHLPMGMIGWNRRSFDGFHFFHKGQCDPGQMVWPSTHELITVLASPRSWHLARKEPPEVQARTDLRGTRPKA
jgi:hypothetical protein